MLLALCCFDLEICTIVRNCGYFLSTESGIEVMLTLFKFSFIHTALNAGVAWPRLVTYKYVVDKNVELQKCWTENWRYSLCHPPTIALWFNFFSTFFFGIFVVHLHNMVSIRPGLVWTGRTEAWFIISVKYVFVSSYT